MRSSDDDHQLLSLIAHELRSPAAVVSGYLRLLLREDTASLPERARHMIEEADRSSARVLYLVKELAELADLAGREWLGSSSPVRIFPLCAEVVQEAARAGDGSELMFSCAPEDEPALVRGEGSRLKRALTALVAATLRERGAKPFELYGVVSQNSGAAEAVIALGDPGLALRRADVLTVRDAAFDPWRGGTGLSVPIACRIVETFGGGIWLPSQASRADCALSFPIEVR